MSTFSPDKTRRRRGGTPQPASGAEDVLCYMDQGSFLGLRALGRGPALHLTWLYPYQVDEAAIRQFGERIAQGFLGRLLQRSPLPWGRHRWVPNPVPGPVTWFRDPIPVESLPTWRSSLVALPLDPEYGPAWRLAVQLLDDGGCAVSFLVSHTIADLLATNQAIADAVAGRPPDHKFPAQARRWSPAMLARDSLESVRALPDVWRALMALFRQPRDSGAGPRRPATATKPNQSQLEIPAEVPLVQVILDAESCRDHPATSGLTVTTLIAAFASRIALRMDRIDASGRVKLVLPVSDRRSGDRRGNALQSIQVIADPDLCRSDPRVLQRDMKAAMASLLRHGDPVSPVLPLTPYVPIWLARRLERMALGADLPVGCSYIGEVPPELGRPFGTASLLQISGLERYTLSDLDRLGGTLFLAGYRLHDRIYITVSGYAPAGVTTRAGLLPLVRDALADSCLRGTVG